MVEFEEIVTFDIFVKEIKKFLSSILKDPIKSELDDFWKDKGFTKGKLIDFLIKKDILYKEEEISEVNSIIIKYKIPKKNFERKLKKIYIFLFEKNLPKKQTVEENKSETPIQDLIKEEIKKMCPHIFNMK